MSATENTILKELSNSTHLIKLNYTNYDKSKKTLFVFVDATEKWFDHFYKNTDTEICANGGQGGRLESINACLGYLASKDISVQKTKSTIYKTADFTKPTFDFCEQIKK
ncbi:hypothetical protein [Tenacibaculum insulae]|uniref:hypothetical protein n=1 Tax=Tenacibaculum insulae TaxID=2029677 RepID=UPI003AB45099